MKQKNHCLSKSLLTTIYVLVCGCSSITPQPTPPETSPTAQTPGAGPNAPSGEEIQKTLSELESRVQAVESKLTSFNDKLNQSRAPTSTATTVVTPPPAQNQGIPVTTVLPTDDPEKGFNHDEPVQAFQKAMTLFQAQQYPESVLAFSDFLERFPDHVIAGTAQYYVGNAYHKQKEYQLALQEFHRVLASYPQSTHVADTLEKMASAEDALKQTEKAAKHRQQLSSLFPHSPAANPTLNASPNFSGPSPLEDEPVLTAPPIPPPPPHEQ